MKTCFLGLLLALSPVIAYAQTTAEMTEEAETDFAKVDKAMNASYQKLAKILDDEGKARLKEAQRAWVAFRNAQAGFDSHQVAGGTMESLEKLGSMTTLTEERTKRLKADYERFTEEEEAEEEEE